MKEIPKYKKNDEINLVDILAAIIKRKWVIIWLMLIAFILSGLYVYFDKQKPQSYRASIIIDFPQEYAVEKEYLLTPVDTKIDNIYKRINDELNSKAFSQKNGGREYYYDYELKILTDMILPDTLEKDLISAQPGGIDVTITGQKEEVAKAVSYLYILYNDYRDEIQNKNKRIFELTQSILQNTLKQKKELLEKYTLILDQDAVRKLPQESIIINGLVALSSDIPMIEESIELNKMVELLEGDFKLIRSGREIRISKDNIEDIENYLESAVSSNSMKRKLLPVFVSVFLAFFVGVFLTFVIEFFSREDVKKRLREKLE